MFSSEYKKMINNKPKEEKVVLETDRLLSDNQYKIIVGIFGIALVAFFKFLNIRKFIRPMV